MKPVRVSLLSAAAVTLALALGSALACVHDFMPEHLTSNPGLYSSAFVLVP